MRTRRRCVLNWNPMGKPAILLVGRIEAVLCVQKMLDEKIVPNNSSKVYAILHTHLVWRLDMLGMLPRRQMQLLCYCELIIGIHCAIHAFILTFFPIAEWIWSIVARFVVHSSDGSNVLICTTFIVKVNQFSSTLSFEISDLSAITTNAMRAFKFV